MHFKSENLAVDWLSFNSAGLTDREHILKIAFYLSE
jgi:hypothetical protein